MDDQDRANSQSTPVATSQFIDVVIQPKSAESTSGAATAQDPELVGDPTVEPAPAPLEVPIAKTADPDESDQLSVTDSTTAEIAQPAKPKNPSAVPIGPIIIAIFFFITLATVALVAFRQGS